MLSLRAAFAAAVPFLAVGCGSNAHSPTSAHNPPLTITVRDGKAVGGVQKLKLNKGDDIRLRVRVDKPHEIHVQGYDATKETEAGKASFNIPAEMKGVFEIEMKDTGTKIGEIRVKP